jgi:hypothetical protein
MSGGEPDQIVVFVFHSVRLLDSVSYDHKALT